MSKALLTISSKNYSSWSLRGWLLCRMAGLDFHEKLLPNDDPDARAELLLLSPSFLVPCLTDGDIKVWDTLAIAEYLYEKSRSRVCLPKNLGGANSLPLDLGRDAFRLRQSAFGAADESQGATIRTSKSGPARRRISTASSAIWRECLKTYDGPYLFGEKPTLADAMYAPVCTRFVTYHVKLDRLCADYCDTILNLPDMLEWIEAAKAEPDAVEELEAEF